jgi:hypothetical protein
MFFAGVTTAPNGTTHLAISAREFATTFQDIRTPSFASSADQSTADCCCGCGWCWCAAGAAAYADGSCAAAYADGSYAADIRVGRPARARVRLDVDEHSFDR